MKIIQFFVFVIARDLSGREFFGLSNDGQVYVFQPDENGNFR